MFKVFTATIALLLLPCLSQASVYFIEPDGSGDFPTIQEAIDASVDGDSILLADGVFYTLEHGFTSVGIVYWGKGITIASVSGDPNTCVLDGDGFLPVNFSQEEDSTAVLDGVTVQNGEGMWGGGIHIRNASPTIRNCIVQNNHGATGGGIHIEENSSPTIESCLIRNNASTIPGGRGGGVYCNYNGTGAPTIQYCLIEDNSSGPSGPEGSGGGMYICSSIAHFSYCIIRNNQGSFGGGGCTSRVAYPSNPA